RSGGHGQYGHCVIKMEVGGSNSIEAASGIEFINKIVGGSIPKEYIPAIKQGVESAARSGIFGYEVTDVKVTLVDGSFHDVDSSELAFKMAGSIAFSEGLKKAKAVLLEPVMSLEVLVPEEYMGEVIGDLNSRRAKIESMMPKLNISVIKAKVPLSGMFGYATDVRSLTQGRGTYSMEFACYEKVPPQIAEKIIGEKKQGGK
ncbi:MAG: elongation factor G, partial [Candidatus Omnitrophica bacterium]|nr:elongation factor G [Candidatus Omnitrophota bacterium]